METIHIVFKWLIWASLANFAWRGWKTMPRGTLVAELGGWQAPSEGCRLSASHGKRMPIIRRGAGSPSSSPHHCPVLTLQTSSSRTDCQAPCIKYLPLLWHEGFFAIFLGTWPPPEFYCNYLHWTFAIPSPGYRHILWKRVGFICLSRKQKFTSCELHWPCFSCLFLALPCHHGENLFNVLAPGEQ